MSDESPSTTRPPTRSPGLGGWLVMGTMMILPLAVSYESLDKFFNTAGSHQCNAVFCYRRDTQVTHREVQTRGGREVSSESVYYCANHASLAEFDLLPRLWRLLVWLFVALCNAITAFAAIAVVMKVMILFQGKTPQRAAPPS